MGSEWKNKNKKGQLSGVGCQRGSDGAVSPALPLQPLQRVPLGALCPLGFCRFSGLLHALEVRDLLLPAGKWKPHQRSRSVLIRPPLEGSPAVTWARRGCSAVPAQPSSGAPLLPIKA